MMKTAPRLPPLALHTVIVGDARPQAVRQGPAGKQHGQITTAVTIIGNVAPTKNGRMATGRSRTVSARRGIRRRRRQLPQPHPLQLTIAASSIGNALPIRSGSMATMLIRTDCAWQTGSLRRQYRHLLRHLEPAHRKLTTAVSSIGNVPPTTNGLMVTTPIRTDTVPRDSNHARSLRFISGLGDCR